MLYWWLAPCRKEFLMSSSSSLDNPVRTKTKVEWGILKGFWRWLLHTNSGGIFGFSFIIIVITLLGWYIPIYSVTHTEISPPKYLHEGDLFTLNNNILGPPTDSVTITLVSKQPFTISLDLGENTREVPAELTFDQRYWIKNQVIRNLGFKIVKAQAVVQNYQYYSRDVPYTIVTTHGYPIINNTSWLILSWLIRGLCFVILIVTLMFWTN
ncbi:MAG: hypothetical protein UZ21_OP11001000785 [Microgenomates bacterium OLB22]|nr:MAG: hypothetical protein UZ21_OP11001000785 [Microgenomates bacterium OLB22]